VRARFARGGAELHVRIEDDGPGFSDTESVLLLHVRGDEKIPGHGVGLAVVSEIVAANHGELRLGRSQALGGGQVDVVLRPA
jgi:two-component system, OmpR family, sensor histidine kinase PhoQ